MNGRGGGRGGRCGHHDGGCGVGLGGGICGRHCVIIDVAVVGGKKRCSPHPDRRMISQHRKIFIFLHEDPALRGANVSSICSYFIMF